MKCLRCKEDKVEQFKGQRICKECSDTNATFRVGKAAVNYKPKMYRPKHRRRDAAN